METTFQKTDFLVEKKKLPIFYPITEHGRPGAKFFQVAKGLLTIIVQGIRSFP